VSLAPLTETRKSQILSRRRCAMCYGLYNNTEVKDGQIAHLDRNNTNAKLENLAYLCFDHHNQYDSKPRQAKGFKEKEVRRYRDELYAFVGDERQPLWTDYVSRKDEPKLSKRPYLSLEVYERRIQTYRIVREFLATIYAYANVTLEQLHQFTRDTDEAVFLFDSEVADYLRELYQKAVSLHFANKFLVDQPLPVGEERTKLVKQKADLLVWFSNQYAIARERLYKHIGLG
jgi:hypothetical protein